MEAEKDASGWEAGAGLGEADMEIVWFCPGGLALDCYGKGGSCTRVVEEQIQAVNEPVDFFCPLAPEACGLELFADFELEAAAACLGETAGEAAF